MSQVRAGYKLTDVGQVPDNWDVVALGEFMKFKNGFNADKTAYGNGTPFINVLEVITKSHLCERDIPGSVRADSLQQRIFGVRRGDVLFNRTSETQNEVALASSYDGDEIVIFGGFVIRGRPDANKLDAKHAGYALRAPVVRRQLIAGGQGAIRANIGQDTLRKVKVALPPLPEQQAIAKALGDMDALIASLEALIAKKRDIKHGAMQDLLSCQRRLPGFRGEWSSIPLKEISAFITKGSTPTTYGFGWVNDGILFLRSECVSETGLDLSQSMIISESAHHALSRSEIGAGDLLITITGNVGRVVLLDDAFPNANINQHIARIRITHPNVEAHFIYH